VVASRPSTERPQILVAGALTLIPLAFFLFASTNPSGLLIALSCAIWAASYRTFESNGSVALRHATLLVLFAGSASLLRGDAVISVFVAVTSGISIAAAKGSFQLSWTKVVAVIAAHIMPVVMALSARQTQYSLQGLQVEPSASTTNFLWSNIVDLPRLLHGTVGGDRLGSPGWLDVPMPAAVPFFVLLGVFLVGTGLNTGNIKQGMRAVAVAFPVVVAAAFGLYALEAGGWRIGEFVQSRYLLPMVAPAALALAASSRPILGSMRLHTLVALTTLAHAIAFSAVLHRYTSRSPVQLFWLNQDVNWWWDVPFSPMSVFVFASVLFWFLLSEVVTWVKECDQ
jgi:hypothetical protein